MYGLVFAKEDNGFYKKNSMYNVYGIYFIFSLKKDILSSQCVLICVLGATLLYTCSRGEA